MQTQHFGNLDSPLGAKGKPAKIGITAVLTMLITNAIPVMGVALGYWSGLAAISLYLIETIIVGLFHFFKMIFFSTFFKMRDDMHLLYAYGMSLFFFIHFFAFVAIQTIFVFVFAEALHIDGVKSAFDFVDNFSPYFHPPFLVSIFAFVGAQIMLFGKEMIQDDVYEELPLSSYMMLPYGRIFIQQFMVIVGAFFIFSTGSMLPIVVLLGILKMIAEYAGLRFGQKWIIKATQNQKKKGLL